MLSLTTAVAQRRPAGAGAGGGAAARPGGFGTRPSMPPSQEPRERDRQGPNMQQPGLRMEKLESAKIGFLTQKLELSPKEAEKFWPIYNQYQNEVRELAKQRMAERRSGSTLSADEQLEEQMETEERMLGIRKKYTREFSRVISSEKVVRLYEAEKEFRGELIKRLQERKR